MINACVEIKATCKKCGQPLPINALVEKVECAFCQAESDFSYQFWSDNILDNVFDDVEDFSEGAGQSSQSFTPQGVFNMTYGRQNPTCRECKTLIDMAKMDDYIKAGKIECTKCQNEILVRVLPNNAHETLRKISYLIGEDSNLISQNSGSVPNSTRLIVYNCPSCAAALDIDGTDRMIKCKSCGSEIYLPDDLWLRLHPVKTVQRWYLGIDEKISADGLTDWKEIVDTTIDKAGNFYMASIGSTTRSENKDCKLWSLSPERKVRWERKDLKYQQYSAGITVTNDGNLYLWDKQQYNLLKLSSADGSTLEIIKGSAPTKDNPFSFTMIGCGSLVCDQDGTIMAIINNEIVRFNQQGKRISLWGDIHEEAKGHGFLSGVFHLLPGSFNEIPEKDPEPAPGIKELGDHPQRCDSDVIKMNIGWDGNIYFFDSSEGYIAKYDRRGKLFWTVKHGLYSYTKAYADVNGNVYVLGINQANDGNVNMLKISPDGKQTDVVMKSLPEKGELNDEDRLAVGYDGMIYAAGDENAMKIFTKDFKKVYTTKQSREDDEIDMDDSDN